MKPLEDIGLTPKTSQRKVAFVLEPGDHENHLEVADSLHTVVDLIIDDKQEEKHIAQIRARSRNNLLGIASGGGGGRMTCWRRRKKVIVGMFIGAMAGLGLILIYHPW